MKKIISIFASSLALTCFGMAHALPGAYLGVQGGVGGAYTKYSTADLSNRYFASGFAYRLSGGYLWNCTALNYGLEVGYSRLSNLSTSHSLYRERVRSYNFDLLGVAKYSFGCKCLGFNIFGKAGAAHVNTKISARNTPIFIDSVRISKSANYTRPEVVVGGGYDFTPNLGLNISYHYIWAGQTRKSTAEDSFKFSPVGALFAGLNYTFC